MKCIFLFYLNVVFLIVHAHKFSQWFCPNKKQMTGMKEKRIYNEHAFLNSSNLISDQWLRQYQPLPLLIPPFYPICPKRDRILTPYLQERPVRIFLLITVSGSSYCIPWICNGRIKMKFPSRHQKRENRHIPLEISQ